MGAADVDDDTSGVELSDDEVGTGSEGGFGDVADGGGL